MEKITKIKQIARTLTLRLLRNPSSVNERMYDSFMNKLTPSERKKVLNDGEVKRNISRVNQLGGLR